MASIIARTCVPSSLWSFGFKWTRMVGLPAANSNASRTRASVISGCACNSRRITRAAMPPASRTAPASQCERHCLFGVLQVGDRLPQGRQHGRHFLGHHRFDLLPGGLASRFLRLSADGLGFGLGAGDDLGGLSPGFGQVAAGLRGDVVEIESRHLRAMRRVGGSDDRGHGQTRDTVVQAAVF